MRELQETIEHEWQELRQAPAEPNPYLRELGSNLEHRLMALTEQMQAVVSELRANGVIRGQSLQSAGPSWPLEDVVRLHNQLRDAPNGPPHEGDSALATRPLELPEAPAELLERLESLERSVSATEIESGRSIGTVWRVAVVLLALSIGVAGVLVSRHQNQVNAATARVSQAELQAQTATKSAADQIAAARQEASQQIAQAREAAEKAQTISDVLAAPDLVRYNLVGGDANATFSAQALYSRSRGLIFSESRLPPLPKDSTYQIWLLSSGEPVSIGTFVPDGNGRFSMASATLPRVQQPVTGVLVTLERAGGNGAPTGRVMLSRPQPIAAIPASGNATS